MDLKKEDGIASQTQDWNAHVFSVAGKKTIIFVNKQTLFSVVAFDLLKNDILNLSNIFLDNYLRTLDSNNLLTPNFESYIKEYDQIPIPRTTDNDRKLMGSLNDFVYHVKGSYEDTRDLSKAKYYALKNLNRMPSKVLNFKSPIEMMADYLKNFS